MTKITNWGSEDPTEVAKGGTGVATNTAYAVLCGGTTATGAIQSIASVGTADQVLTSNGAGALPTFQDAGGGGGEWTYIGSETASSDAYVEFTSLSDSYKQFVIYMVNVRPASDQVALYAQVGITGPTYRTSSYAYSTGGGNLTESSSAGYILICNDAAGYSSSQGNGSTEYLDGMLTLHNPASASFYTSMTYSAMYRRAGDGDSWVFVGGAKYLGAQEANTAIKFYYSSGNISVGTFYLYGVA